MKRIHYISLFTLIGIVIAYSLGNTLSYYFYTDDYVFLYYLRNNLNFGWPYSSVLAIFRPIYQLFGISPLPYFTLALVTYFFAAVGVFFFSKKLTHNNLVSGAAAVIFSTGYIGLDHFGMIAVSIVNNINVINVTITLSLLLHFLETKKIRYYFLTLLMFWISLLLFPYRAYPLVLFLPTIQLLKTFQWETPRKMIRYFAFFTLQYIPFFIAGIFRGIFSYGTHGTDNVDLFNLFNSGSKIYTFIDLYFFKELFAVLGKFVLIKQISDLFSFVPSQDFYAVTGFMFFLITLVTPILLSKKKKIKNGRTLVIILLLTIESYVGNMVLNIDFDRNGPVNRYLTISFLFFAILVPALFYIYLEKLERFKFINKKWGIVILSIIIVLCLSSLARKYERDVSLDRSEPAKAFFKELKAYVPSISNSDYNVFYFDRASYYPVSTRFGNVLLSAAMGNSVNLALPYNVSVNAVKIVDNFEDFLRLVYYPPKGKKMVYHSFYNDESGLHQTTKEVFNLIENGKITNIPNANVKYIKDKGQNSVEIETNGVSSLTPTSVRISLSATPTDPSRFTFPFSNPEISSEFATKTEKTQIFSYLIARSKYYDSVKAEAESIHVGKKNPVSFLIDDNPETFWISDQSRWEVKIKPWIKLDLSEERNVGRLIWRQQPGRMVDKFDVEVSLDGNSWTKVSNLVTVNVSSDGSLMAADFSPVTARYVRFTINSLSTGPGPSLNELEIVESNYKNVDLEKAYRIKNSPFEYIKDAGDLAQTYEYLYGNAKLKVRSLSNKDDPASKNILYELPIFLDGNFHEYEFFLPQGGTMLKKIILDANYPAEFLLQNVIIENKSKDALINETKTKCEEFSGVEIWKNAFDCT